MTIEKIPAARLNPAAYNPRKDLKPGDREYEKLKRSIAEFGYVEPVIWNRQTGNVVGGHQRLKVLIDLGQQEIDCVVVDLDLQREKALNIALNKIQGDWDEGKLASLMAEFDASAFDVSLTGFDAEEVDALLNRFYSHEAAEDNFDAEGEKKKNDLVLFLAHDLKTLVDERMAQDECIVICGSLYFVSEAVRLFDHK